MQSCRMVKLVALVSPEGFGFSQSPVKTNNAAVPER